MILSPWLRKSAITKWDEVPCTFDHCLLFALQSSPVSGYIMGIPRLFITDPIALMHQLFVLDYTYLMIYAHF